MIKPKSPRQRVLVFEDLDDQFVMINEALRSAGYRAIRAASPESFRSHEPYDDFVLILMDLFFGQWEKAGIELTREVHQINPHIPIVMVSNREPGRNDVAEAFRAGACDYVDKKELARDVLAAMARVTAISEGTEEVRMEAQLPLPMAFLFRDFRRSHTSYKRRLERMVELFEVTLKFVTFSLLSAHREDLRKLLRSPIKDALAQPSLGQLMNAVTALPEVPGFLGRLSKVTQRPAFRDICGQFIQLRNDYVGHGAPQREPVYAELVEKHQPEMNELLKMLSCLQEWQLVVPLRGELPEDGYAYDVRVFRGSNPEPTVDHKVAELALRPSRHVHYVDGKFRESVDLFPWCQYLACDKCMNEKLFLYRLCRHGEVWMLDHIYGHALQTRSGWKELHTMLEDSPT